MDTQKEYATLMEAYNAVYENQEQLDEASPRISRSMGRRATQYRKNQEQDAHMERVKKHQERMANDPEYAENHRRLSQVHSRKEDQKESFDLFDYLLEYLVAEGYADTNKAALAIMANMSEEWKQDIVEAKYGTKAGRKALAKKIRKGEEIGKSGPGTGFEAVKKAAKKGGARDPEAVAAAAMWKTHGGKKG